MARPARTKSTPARGPARKKIARAHEKAPAKARSSAKAASIGSRMTASPITIPLDSDLGNAIALMEEHGIRHLPVLDEGRLVGIVSERDLSIIESLVPDEWERIVVAEAMTPSPYAVAASTPISEVAKTMAERKYGCVVVTGPRGALLGLFTTTDALRMLAETKTARSVGQVVRAKTT